MITLIAACSKNRAIGKDNKLLWYLPNDLKRFKRLTTGKTVVMGRKTFESIGKPLPNRKNIILTNNKGLLIEGCEVITSISELNLIEDIVIIGLSHLKVNRYQLL